MAHEPDPAKPDPLSQEGPTLALRSCHDCHRRKVRCNKLHPCDNCVRLGVKCTFPPPGRQPQTRPRRSNKSELMSRLAFLERKIEDLGALSAAGVGVADPHGEPDSQKSPGNRSVRSDPLGTRVPYVQRSSEDSLGQQFGRLVIDPGSGSSRYVNHQVLADMGSQIEELRLLFDSPSLPALSSDEDAPLPPTAAYAEAHSSFLFGYHSLVYSLCSYHPSPTTSYLLLEVFEENIAPIMMIIHRPALRRIIQTASTNPDGLAKSTEAQAFSIYFAAVSSMTTEQCLSQLGEDRATLVDRYRFAVEQALARAGFLHTRKLAVLQAAVLFLACACDPKDAQFVWTMIAVVTRLGLGQGLHRDGSHFGLSPFETEMRRRLWWYIYLLDVQASEIQATSPQIREGDYDTRLPLNLNDDDLQPDSMEPPQEQTGFTEMTLTLVRCEILITRRNLIQMTGVGDDPHNELFKNRNLAIEEARHVLDERYLQFSDLSVPVHWVAATIARIALSQMWLVAHFSFMTTEGFNPNLWPDRCELLILTAIEVLEFTYLLETHESTSQWAWLFQGYVQWQSFAFLLSELCVRPNSALSDRAWTVVNRVYEQWNEPAHHKRGLVMRPLERLMKRAVAIRDHQLCLSGLALPFESNIPDPFTPNALPDLENLPMDSLTAETTSLDIFRDVLMNVGL
ncbi:fungal-specific transcription factor domain protein [Aspergillus ellipticus CBS 707.79]|uniref:Fungal-specific transcription factor domain protein n=1 Tax=Aspergillus ellipticus CBS 707.79 TaxID=1448320 RepID=A0A319DWE1_9EURO|nr:fungal-specific transcription factor domain protein [Aspergillus ellipticus CBS 707.79]